MDWPPSSPDLNPIENIWAQLKRRIQRREQKAGHPARTRGKLIAIAQEEWEGIDWEGVDKAIAGMGGRIATVIQLWLLAGSARPTASALGRIRTFGS